MPDQPPTTNEQHTRSARIPLLLIVLWCTYSLNGFRGWWQPIKLSDTDAGSAIRQLLFAGSAALSFTILVYSRQLWNTLKSQRILIFVALWLLASTLYSDIPSTTFKRAVLFTCGSFTAATFVALSKQPLLRATQTLLGICAAAAIVSLTWMVLFPASITTNPGRPGLAGISNHPNTIAPAFAIGLTLALGYPCKSAKTTILVKAVCLPTCALALALTTSVTSIFFGLVCCAVLAVLLLPAYWKAATAILTAVFSAGVALIGPERIKMWVLNGINRDATMSGRGELWSIIASKFREEPFFGRGWGAFWTEGRGRQLVTTWNPRQSHNAYLDILLDVGVVGLAIFAILIAPALLRILTQWAHNSSQTPRAVLASLIAVSIGLFTIYALQQSFVGKVDSFAFIALLLIVTAVAEQATRDSGTACIPMQNDLTQRLEN